MKRTFFSVMFLAISTLATYARGVDVSDLANSSEGIFYVGAAIVLLLFAVMMIVILKIHVNQEMLKNEKAERRFEKLYDEKEAILSALPIGVEVYSAEGILIDINKAECETFGVKREDVVGVINIQENPAIPEELKNAFKARLPINLTFSYHFKKITEKKWYSTNRSEDSILWVNVIGRPNFDDRGVCQNYVFIASNVTDDYKRTKELEATKLNLSLAINAGNIAVWGYDIAHDVVYNIQGEVYDDKTVNFETMCDLIHQSDIELFKMMFNELVQGRSKKMRSKLRCKKTPDAEYRYVQREIVAIYGEDGKPEKIIGTHCDITNEVIHDKRKNEVARIIEDSRNELRIKNKELENAQLNLSMSLEAGGIGVWQIDPKTRVLKHLHGNIISNDNETFDVVLKRIDPSGYDEFVNTWDKIFAGEISAIKTTTPFRDLRTGEVSYIENRIITQKNDDGELINIVGTHRDITESYLSQQILEAKNRTTEIILRTCGLVLWEYDVVKKEFTTYNDSYNNYDSSVKIGLEEISMYFNPDDLDQSYLETNEKMIAGENISFSYNLRAKSPNEKEWQYTFITGSPIEVDSAGKVTKFVGLRQDETNIIKLSKEFAEKNTQLNMVLKAGLISSIIIDVERDLMRITSDDILTTNNRRTIFNDEWTPLEDVFKIIHPDDRILLQKSLELLKKGELSTLREEIRIDPDGEYLDSYEANFIVLNYDKKEIPKTIIGYIQNITENKLLLSDLRRAKEQAEQSNKLKSAFLANMSHEIRTPLNAIVGFSELITEIDSATERNEYIKIIKNNNELLLRLIGDILDLSKIEAGMIEMKPEKFDLSRDFDDAYITLKQKCNNPKIEFLHVNPYVSCEVYLDRNRLLQIITNYATNAIKYTIKGSITLSYEVVDHGVKITVSDTGIGVAEEKKHKLFQRFEKLDDFAQGTGLGLSIVKALTEVAGGNVGFETEEGIGSTFWAWIPTESVVVEKKKSLDLVLKSICDRNEKQIDLDESAKKVLIADDSDSNYLVLARLMQGYKIDRAGNGLEAIDKAKAGGYDIIMMDIRMPEIDGFTATSIIREFDDLVPIIAITANASDSDRIKALEAGCNAFVSKPINKRDLDDAINAVFNSSQQG